jgi:hypothetical protein
MRLVAINLDVRFPPVADTGRIRHTARPNEANLWQRSGPRGGQTANGEGVVCAIYSDPSW